SGRAITHLPTLARFAPPALLLDLADQVSTHLREGRSRLWEVAHLARPAPPLRFLSAVYIAFRCAALALEPNRVLAEPSGERGTQLVLVRSLHGGLPCHVAVRAQQEGGCGPTLPLRGDYVDPVPPRLDHRAEGAGEVEQQRPRAPR